jgi:hypothetical protein
MRLGLFIAAVLTALAWMSTGIPALAAEPSRGLFSADDRGYWLFQEVRRPAPPTKLEAAAIAPSPQADRRTLIRRAYFDLHGLPPTPDQVDEFVGDTRPDAYERLIDRLLVSPRYGERWARHWLDLVRYG